MSRDAYLSFDNDDDDLYAANGFVVVSTLAGIGIHGVIGHDTSLRWNEAAVRIAVGAHPATIA